MVADEAVRSVKADLSVSFVLIWRGYDHLDGLTSAIIRRKRNVLIGVTKRGQVDPGKWMTRIGMLFCIILYQVCLQEEMRQVRDAPGIEMGGGAEMKSSASESVLSLEVECEVVEIACSCSLGPRTYSKEHQHDRTKPDVSDFSKVLEAFLPPSYSSIAFEWDLVATKIPAIPMARNGRALQKMTAMIRVRTPFSPRLLNAHPHIEMGFADHR